MENTSLYKKSAMGSYGAFDIEILVGASKLPDLQVDAIRRAADKAVQLIEAAVMVEVIRNDPEAQEQAATERRKLLALFPGEPFVETIPNGYCPDYCCAHLPWFVVTTQVGRIQLGWRKRVIQIDWSQTHRTKNAHELFADEVVTKGERMIHAWSYEDAQRYINTILQSAQ